MDFGAGASSRAEASSGINVFVRIRPLSDGERQKFPLPAIVASSDKDVNVRGGPADTSRSYTFSRVFGPDSTQKLVYSHAVAPVIQDVVNGYNCTVFAYGQTGTGKTFTMEGERSNPNVPWDDDPTGGMIPRAVHNLFDALQEDDGSNERSVFAVSVSYVELYNENLYDLLAPPEAKDATRSKLQLYDDPMNKGSVILKGVTQKICKTKEEVITQLECGAATRRKASTLLNARSSRSHAIFMITVYINDEEEGGGGGGGGGGAGAGGAKKKGSKHHTRTGKLNLVDLAGSESIGRSGAKDTQAREAGCINKSLLNLRIVIKCLAEGNSQHIPYRGSKLTRILQDSLGGKTKTTLIATVSPVNAHLEESISTLDYACKAKSIMNHPEATEKCWEKLSISAYIDRIEQLRSDLNATRQQFGVYMRPEDYVLWNRSHQEKLTIYLVKRTELENLLSEKDRLEKIQAYMKSREDELSHIAKKLEDCAKEADFVGQTLANRHKIMSEKGQEILAVAQLASSEMDSALETSRRMREVNVTNREAFGKFRADLQGATSSFTRIADAFEITESLADDEKDFLERLQDSETGVDAGLKSSAEATKAALAEIKPTWCFDPVEINFDVPEEAMDSAVAVLKEDNNVLKEILAALVEPKSVVDAAIESSLVVASNVAEENAAVTAEARRDISECFEKWAGKSKSHGLEMMADWKIAMEKIGTAKAKSTEAMRLMRDAFAASKRMASYSKRIMNRGGLVLSEGKFISEDLNRAQDDAAGNSHTTIDALATELDKMGELLKKRSSELESPPTVVRETGTAQVDASEKLAVELRKFAVEASQKRGAERDVHLCEISREMGEVATSCKKFDTEIQGLSELTKIAMKKVVGVAEEFRKELDQSWLVDGPGKVNECFDRLEGSTDEISDLFENLINGGFVEYNPSGATPKRRGDGENMGTPLRIPGKPGTPMTPREAIVRKNRDVISQLSQGLVDTPQVDAASEASDDSKENVTAGLETPVDPEKGQKERGTPLSAAPSRTNSGVVGARKKIREN